MKVFKREKKNNKMQSTQMSQPNVKTFPHNTEIIELFIRKNIAAEVNIKVAVSIK